MAGRIGSALHDLYLSGLTICEMQIQDFHVPVGKIIPEFDGELAKHVNIYSPASGIALHVIRKSGRGCSNVAKALKQVALLTCPKCAEKIENINGDEQP
jgi:hypothetical protein